MKLSEQIYAFRRRAKLSQEELAEQVGVSRQAVSKWERGEATPDVEKLVALARVFQVTVDELLNAPEQNAGELPDPPPDRGTPPAPGGGPGLGAGLLERLIRQYGWLFGVYVCLSGLGITLVGGLARYVAGKIAASVHGLTASFFSGGVTYNGPPELEAEIMEQLGIGPATQVNGLFGVFVTISTVILAVGLLTAVTGAVLALVLYRKGRR